MRELTIPLYDENWFIKQNERYNLGCVGGESLVVNIDATRFMNVTETFDPSINYYLDMGEDTVVLDIGRYVLNPETKKWEFKTDDKRYLTTMVENFVFAKGGSVPLQVRGNNKLDSKISNVVYGYVNPSVSGTAYTYGIPTEYRQFEQKIRDIIKGLPDTIAERVEALEAGLTATNENLALAQGEIELLKGKVAALEAVVEELQDKIDDNNHKLPPFDESLDGKYLKISTSTHTPKWL